MKNILNGKIHNSPTRSEDLLFIEGRVRQRAFEIHQARGGHHRRVPDDWLQAEAEINAEMEQQAEAFLGPKSHES
jgi:hypothetical protein